MTAFAPASAEHTRKISRSAEHQALQGETQPAAISPKVYAVIFLTREGRQEMFAYTTERTLRKNIVHILNRGGAIVWVGAADMPTHWIALPLR